MWGRKPDVVLVVQPKQFKTADEVMDAMELMTDLIMSHRLTLVESGDRGSITVKGRPRMVEKFLTEFERLHDKQLI